MGNGENKMSSQTSITPLSNPQAASVLSEKLKETREGPVLDSWQRSRSDALQRYQLLRPPSCRPLLAE